MRLKDIGKIPAQHDWTFQTKLQLALAGLRDLMALAILAKKTVWIVFDGAYAKRALLRPLQKMGITVVSRLRKDAALRTVPPVPKQRQRGQPRKYGRERIHLQRRAAHRSGWEQVQCFVYGQLVTKTIKTFLAAWRPAGGVIRVVIVKEDHGCAFSCVTGRPGSRGTDARTSTDRCFGCRRRPSR